MAQVSCIIPAHNEAARIGRVLEVVSAHAGIDEIIVVDDGSSDETALVAARFPAVRLIKKRLNHGKSEAVAEGVRASSGDLLVFLDADLMGLTGEDLSALLAPVTEGEADLAISLRGNALLPWRVIGLDYVSGERVFKRSLIADHLEEMSALPGFGLEVYVNELLIESRARIKVVSWPNVDSPYKARKQGFWRGTLGEVRMLMNIVETISLMGTAYQIIALRRARV